MSYRKLTKIQSNLYVKENELFDSIIFMHHRGGISFFKKVGSKSKFSLSPTSPNSILELNLIKTKLVYYIAGTRENINSKMYLG